ncbi:unnamed protein product [Rhizopus microsporus]
MLLSVVKKSGRKKKDAAVHVFLSLMLIQQHLQQFLSRTHTNHKTFHVFNLTLINTHHLHSSNSSNTSYRHRLLLVSAPTVGFISGLETYEYTISKQDKIEHMIYISKVDTTMTTEETRGVTRQLVLAYIASLPSNSTVFVFARAQPQYLFANSAKNTDKVILSDRDLVSWWLHTLNKAPNAEKGWWFVPGVEDESSALIEIGARKRQWEAAFDWTYGSSYSPDAKAIDVIPRFEDDAKARFLKDHVDDDLSVKGFWELLAFSEECGLAKSPVFSSSKSMAVYWKKKKPERKRKKMTSLQSFGTSSCSWTFTIRNPFYHLLRLQSRKLKRYILKNANLRLRLNKAVPWNKQKVSSLWSIRSQVCRLSERENK